MEFDNVVTGIMEINSSDGREYLQQPKMFTQFIQHKKKIQRDEDIIMTFIDKRNITTVKYLVCIT